MSSKFNKNMKYIVRCLSKVKEKSISYGELAELFNVSRMTVHTWDNDKHIPQKRTTIYIATVLESEFGWKITSDELHKSDISKLYDVDQFAKKRETSDNLEYVEHMESNPELVGKRLEDIRKSKGWTLIDVANKSKSLFPENKTFHISHSYIAEIEKGKKINFHINKILALTKIYQINLNYLFTGNKPVSKITVDKVNKVLIIPLTTEFLEKNKREIDSFCANAEEVLESIEPNVLNLNSAQS